MYSISRSANAARGSDQLPVQSNQTREQPGSYLRLHLRLLGFRGTLLVPFGFPTPTTVDTTVIIIVTTIVLLRLMKPCVSGIP